MCEPSQCSAPWENTMLFPYQFNCLCWKICYVGYCYVGCDKYLSLDAERVTAMVLQAVSLRFCVPSENGVTRWGCCSIHCWAEIVYWRCDGNRDGSAISDQNWIKNREAAASRFTLPRLNWQINQRLNEPIFPPLLFASLSFLDSFFPSGLLFEKKSFSKTWHVVFPFHVTSQVSRYLDGSFQLSLSPETDLWKENSKPNLYFVYVLEMFLHIFANQCKEESLGTSFFAKHTFSFWSSIWSSTVEVPFICIDLCRFSVLDVPPSGPENVPKPCLPPYESPLSAVSSTCKEITWDKCYGSVMKCAPCPLYCKPD